MKFDKKAIMEAADAEMVAEYIGMEIQRRGTHKSILCPVHDDNHFGSCYLTPKGFRCFACGAKGDVFTLVQEFNKCSFYEAAETVAEACGGKDLFLLSSEASQKQKEDIRRLPKREDLALIGITSRGLWVTNCDEDTDYEEVQECIDPNPLLSLYKEDPDAYRQLISDKATEAVNGFQRIINALDHETSGNLFAQLCFDLAKTVGPEKVRVYCLDCIHRAETIAIEYGNGIRKPSVDRTPNMFSRIMKRSRIS